MRHTSPGANGVTQTGPYLTLTPKEREYLMRLIPLTEDPVAKEIRRKLEISLRDYEKLMYPERKRAGTQ